MSLAWVLFIIKYRPLLTAMPSQEKTVWSPGSSMPDAARLRDDSAQYFATICLDLANLIINAAKPRR
jgi:hypothetical protein